MFNISELLTRVYGYVPPQFDVEKGTVRKEYSDLGAPYYGKDSLGREYFLPVKLGNVKLPLPVIGITTQKKIIATPLVHRDGTVKEILGQDDYRITIKGICLSQDGSNNWPESEVTALKNLNDIKAALEIECVLASIFSIEVAVIQNLEIIETKGFKGAVGYIMYLLSDKYFDLKKL